MERKRKKLLNQLIKLVKKESEYTVANNNFSKEDIEYLNANGVMTETVDSVRDGLIGEYDVRYKATRLYLA